MLRMGYGSGVSADMAECMDCKDVVGFREPVAAPACIWTTGTFACGDPGLYFSSGDGLGNGSISWCNVPAPSAVPGLGVAEGAAKARRRN